MLLMEDRLLEHLKELTTSNWLIDYPSKILGDACCKGKAHRNRELYQLTLRQLQLLVASTAKAQVRLKVFLIENDPIQFLASFLAAIIAKTDLFICDPNWREQEWQQVFNLVQPDLILADATTKTLVAKIRLKQNKYDQDVKNTAAYLEEKPLIMIPTGGTSGKVRFAIHTWSTLTASVTGFGEYFKLKTINSFCILPLYHVSGLMQFMRSLITKGNLLILPYGVIKKARVTIPSHNYFISLVPTQLQFLIEFDPLWLANFKTVLLGGAPASRSLLSCARKYNIPLAPTYGMTETASQIVTLKPEDFLRGNNSSGQVLPHAQVKIIKDQDFAQEQQTGLISISSRSLCLGYYPQMFNLDQSFHTDDLGWFDAQGYLHLVGRNSHKIITGGENVFPVEVEAAILETQLVKDVCVIGLADAQWGQVVTALYIPGQANLDLAVIKQKLQPQLAKYKHPKNWLQVNSLPRNNRGKINYQELKAIAKQLLDKSAKNNLVNIITTTFSN
jgi:o-succinylbenzoate---CoA ligase